MSEVEEWLKAGPADVETAKCLAVKRWAITHQKRKEHDDSSSVVG